MPDDVIRIPIPIPFPMGYVNCYLLLGEGAVLVDCGLDTPEARDALERGLAERGLKVGDLDRIILTHHHPDHYGLAGLLEAEGPSIWMLDVELERGHQFWVNPEQGLAESRAFFLRGGVSPQAVDELLEELRVNQTRVHPPRHPQAFHDGEVLELAGRAWRVVWTPGHADGHAMLFREEDGLLLAGDQILERISPNISLWPYSRPNPLADFLHSLEVTANLEARLALPGHYQPIAQIAQRVQELKQHHAERLELLFSFLDQPLTCWEASLKLFPGPLNPAQRRFAWAETLAHLEYLVDQGTLLRLEGAVIRYARA